jgi:hydrogenase nickel incorporation protein HypA/HybF
MHELSIAQAVVAIAARHAEGRRVCRIEVKVGHLRQVVPAALEFAFQVLTEGTEMDGAELVIEEVPARTRCRACQAVTTTDQFPLACAGCHALDVELVAGEELLVDALEFEETTEGMAHGC